MRMVAAFCDETGQRRPPLVAAAHAPQSLRDLLALRPSSEEGEGAVGDQLSPRGGERAKYVHPFILANIFEHSVLSVLAADRAVSPGLPPLALLPALVALPPNLSPLLEGRIVAIFVHDRRAATAGEQFLAVALGHLEVAGRAEDLSLFDSFGFLLSLHYAIIRRAPLFFWRGGFYMHVRGGDWRLFSKDICRKSAWVFTQRYILMFGSKINQLSESSFRQRPSLIKSSGYEGRVASILIGADEPSSAPDLREELRDYLLSLPPCPYHHEPIELLCLSPSCPSSTFSLCSHPHCKSLHSHPDSELIQLQSFNEFMGNNCRSMLLLSRKASSYLSEIKQKFALMMDKAIAKTKYIFDNVYIGEVPRLIRQGRHHELTSKRLFQFVKHGSFENNAQQRIQMEGLRNEVATRIAEMQQNFDKLAQGRELQGLLLADIVKSTQEDSPFAMNGRMDIHRFQSTILEGKEEFEEVFRLLKENRAPTFSSISTIFRASEHHFSAEAFHRTADGRGPLLLIVKTTLGKKFGAFLNCRLQQREEWIPDATGLSFIFSLDRRQAYKLKSQAKCRLKAAFGGPQGPQIGSGCDLYLMDQCHLKRTSGANLGGSYKLPPYIEAGSPKAKTYLAGEEFFLVSEYEVCLFE